MTTVTCDLCGKKPAYNHEIIRVQFRDGEHPHCGSTMHKMADCCLNCLGRIPGLETQMEFDEMQRIIVQ